MARQHTTNETVTNPEVRFERTDIDLGAVVKFGVGFAALVAVSIGLTVGLFRVLRTHERTIKKTDLPPASVDADNLPPKPRLESIEDVRTGRTALMPPRAKQYLTKQEEILDKGDKAKGILPIEETITLLAGRLPCRKGPNGAPPDNFTRRLPSKAASGRVETGGQ